MVVVVVVVAVVVVVVVVVVVAADLAAVDSSGMGISELHDLHCCSYCMSSSAGTRGVVG